MTSQTTAPLLLTSSSSLADEVARLAAAADAAPTVVDDPVTALPAWSTASVVLVGADLLGELAQVHPPRRSRVHVVSLGPVPDLAFRQALAVGAESVAELPGSASWLVELLGDVGERSGQVVGVVGGAGGAGATTYAVAVAQAAARTGPALLVDTDPLGPGLDRMLGMEGTDGARWESLQRTSGRLSSRSLREAVPRRDGLGVLTWSSAVPGSVQAFAAREAVEAGRRGHDLVVVDLSREGPLLGELAARCDVVAVVTPASIDGATSAVRVVARLGAAPTGLVLRPGSVDHDLMAATVGLPVFAPLPDQRGVTEAVELGCGPLRSRRGPLARAVHDLLDRVAPARSAA